MITMLDHRLYAERAFAARATGFVRKDAADQELCAAVRCAAQAVRYCSPRLRCG